jgi:putative transcriptional regulator
MPRWTFGLALLLAAALAHAAPPAILLVADPALGDPNFRETVVLVAHHTEVSGPFGVILNRPLPLTVAQAFPEKEALAKVEDRVHFGGPVAIKGVFFVYRAATRPDSGVEVTDGVYLDWNSERLRELLARDKPTEGLRLFAGHAAWSPGQLEAEVALGSWKSARPEERIIFSPKPETLWPELERRGRLAPVRQDTGASTGGSPWR